MKKDTQKESELIDEPTSYQDEYAGQGGSYLYDPITKTRTPIKEEDLNNG